ncbi:MAG TPA: hypothetical protein VN838_13980 [Bradyrhizobium sp.]|nr:hypothetical protein [Bradyrhizobium sp.]
MYFDDGFNSRRQNSKTAFTRGILRALFALAVNIADNPFFDLSLTFASGTEPARIRQGRRRPGDATYFGSGLF